MAFNLPILNLGDTLLHYYERLDDDYYHVIRSMHNNDEPLDLIAANTKFKKEVSPFSTLSKIILANETFDGIDAEALKRLFPATKVAQIDDEKVVLDKRTINFGRATMDSYFSNAKSTRSEASRIFDLSNNNSDRTAILSGIAFQVDLFLNSNDIERFYDDIQPHYENFRNGLLNKDNLFVWKSFLNNELSFISQEALSQPFWSAITGRIRQDIAEQFKPGFHFFEQTAVPEQSLEENKHWVTLRTKDELRLVSGNAFEEMMGRPCKQTVPNAIPTKGFIERSRLTVSNTAPMSHLIDVVDISPLDLLRLDRSTSVASNAVKRQQAEPVLAEIAALLESTPGEANSGTLNQKARVVMEKLLQAKALLGLDTFTALPIINGHGDRRILLSAGLDVLVSQLNTNVVEFRDFGAEYFAAQLDSIRDNTLRDEPFDQYITLQQRDKLGQVLKEVLHQALDFSLEFRTLDLARINAIEQHIDTLDASDDLTQFFRKPLGQAVEDAIAHFRQIDRYCQEQLGIVRQAEARQVLVEPVVEQQVVSPMQQSLLVDPQQAGKHDDVGEKIGGARKDQYTRISTAQLAELSLEEQVAFVHKNKVWPNPDWKYEIDNGMEPMVAVFIKRIRSMLDPVPQQLSQSYYSQAKNAKLAQTEEDIYYWMRSLEIIRDHLMGIKKAESIYITVKQLYQILEQNLNQAIDSGEAEAIDSSQLATFTNLDALGNTMRRKLSYPFAMEREYRVHASRWSRLSDDEICQTVLKIKPQNPAPAQEGQAPSDTENTQVDGAPKLALPVPPHLKSITREGINWRNGQNITGDDLVSTFGFRAIEYGNWVSNHERQVVLNHAYDAFMDLAFAMGLPKEHLSMLGFDNRLALSFGSRGKGRAMAHYEPLKKVINLTKIKGAGSLAHEWMHALDHYVGDITRSSSLYQSLYSEVMSKSLDSMQKGSLADVISNGEHLIDYHHKEQPEEVKRLAGALITTLLHCQYKDRTEDDNQELQNKVFTQRAEHIISWARYAAVRWVNDQPFDGAKPDIYSKELAGQQMDKTVAILRALCQNNTVTPTRLLAELTANHICDAQIINWKVKGIDRDITPDVHARITDEIEENYLLVSAKRQANLSVELLLRDLQAINRSSRVAKTHFLKEAESLDVGSKKYWAKPYELLARSFSVSMYDTLKAHQSQSDYLVRGAEPYEFSDRSVFKGNANPEGEERQRINSAYQQLAIAYCQYASHYLGQKHGHKTALLNDLVAPMVKPVVEEAQKSTFGLDVEGARGDAVDPVEGLSDADDLKNRTDDYVARINGEHGSQQEQETGQGGDVKKEQEEGLSMGMF